MLKFSEAHNLNPGDRIYQVSAIQNGVPVQTLAHEVTAIQKNAVDIVRRDEWGETHQRFWRNDFPLFLWQLEPVGVNA
jgi:hypothetical protein